MYRGKREKERNRRTTRKGNEIQKERPIERALYDWTFRAFLRKGRAGTRVLLAKTKERRLGGGPWKRAPKLSDGVYLCVEPRKKM